MWQSGDSEYSRVDVGWLERLIVRHPIRTPVIALGIAAVLFVAAYFTGMALLSRFGIFLLIISFLLLLYGLIRKAIDISVRRRKPARTQLPDEPIEANQPKREEIVTRWRQRAEREALGKKK